MSTSVLRKTSRSFFIAWVAFKAFCCSCCCLLCSNVLGLPRCLPLLSPKINNFESSVQILMHMLQTYQKMNETNIDSLLAVSSATRSMPFFSSPRNVGVEDKTKLGLLSCHCGFFLVSGRTGRKRIGLSVFFPLLLPRRGD